MEQYNHAYIQLTLRSVIDGLKETERKLLYVGLKQKGTYNTNQLAIQVMDKTQYYHSEQGLIGVIFSLMKDNENGLNMFVDCNNYLKSSLQKYHDRHGTTTQLNPIFRSLFSVDDEHVLTYITIEGKQCEPQFYVPIIPLILLEEYDVISLCCEMLKILENEPIDNKIFADPKMLLNTNGEMQSFSSTQEIIEEFYKVKIEMYTKRKTYMAEHLNNEIKEIKNKMRFIGCVMDGHIKINTKTHSEIEEFLQSLSFDLIDGSYKYLFDMPLKSVCYEYWSNLENKLVQTSQQLEYYTRTSENIYRDEINKFITFRNHMLNNQKIELTK